MDQTCSNLIKLYQNGSNWFKIDQIFTLVFFGHGRAINMLGHGRAIHTLTSNKRVGYNKRVGQKIHSTRSTIGQGGIFNLLHENQRVGWTFFLKRIMSFYIGKSIFGHEKGINIFGYWKAIIILWNIFTRGQLGLWEIWTTWTLGNLQTT